MKKPQIGVTPLYDAQKASYWMLPGYFLGIEAAGGLPVMLPLTEKQKDLEQLGSMCDGVLFAGGQDVTPAVYGREQTPNCGETCPERDRMERRLLQILLEQDKPLLGICRGLQFLNAALGGTLYQDLSAECPGALKHRMDKPYDDRAHAVDLTADEPLSTLLQTDRIQVNSCHHQGIRTLAPALRSMAVADDGLIEAVWMPEKRFVWAVQWHPEFLYRKDEASRRLFEAFVQASAM